MSKNHISQIKEPICYKTGEYAVFGECPVHHGDSCLHTPIGLVEMIQKYEKICNYMNLSLADAHDIPPAYDPNFGDEKICQCGHEYYRHFDTYENMRAVGCKYCWDPYCDTFVLMQEELDLDSARRDPPRSSTSGSDKQTE